jgi:alpha-amylase
MPSKDSSVKPFALKSALLPTLFLLAAPFLTATEDGPASAPWWRNATFYQIFVRSFADSTTGPLAGDGIGDLQGMIERLDYLNDGDPTTSTDLGVSAVWLLPLHPSPSYHGYDVTNYYAVNPDYGDVALFKEFLNAAHRRGIRVIIDLVLNHASAEHPFFERAADEDATPSERDLFIFSEHAKHNAGPWGERCWHYRDGGFYYGIFDGGMPDWNFRSPAVTDHHREVAAFWLDVVGVDGFRLDAVRYFFEQEASLQDLPETKRWLREFADYCRELKPDVYLIGEAWADTEQAASYVTDAGLDSTFEFDLAKAFIESASFASPVLVARRLEWSRAAYDDAVFGTFLANHDQERTLSQLGGDLPKARLAALLQFTAPGIPFIYYGEEIGMLGKKPDPDLRTPLQWGAIPNAGFTTGTPWRAINPDYSRVNIDALSTDRTSLLSLYRHLVRLRSKSEALRGGTPVAGFSYVGPGVYADLRESAADVVLVAVNTTTREGKLRATLPASVGALGKPVLLFGSTPPLTAGSFDVRHSALVVPPQAAAVFQWRKP